MDKRIYEILIETENFKVGQDWEVPIPAFLILACKDKNKKRITDFSEGENIEMIKLIVKVRRLMDEVLQIKDVYFFQNEDTEHGFHIWIFPRLPWMEEFGRKIQSVRPIMNYAKENLWTEENLKEVKLVIEKLKKNW